MPRNDVVVRRGSLGAALSRTHAAFPAFGSKHLMHPSSPVVPATRTHSARFPHGSSRIKLFSPRFLRDISFPAGTHARAHLFHVGFQVRIKHRRRSLEPAIF